MKVKIFLLFLFVCNFSFGQNVKIEIVDYYKKIEGKEFSKYQFAHASYSSSRASIVFIVSKNQFADIINKIPDLFAKKKQEYTDVWILGINLIDKNTLSEVENKIVTGFFNEIIKYRSDNSLPAYDLNRLKDSVIFLDDPQSLCKHLICPKILKKSKTQL